MNNKYDDEKLKTFIQKNIVEYKVPDELENKIIQLTVYNSRNQVYSYIKKTFLSPRFFISVSFIACAAIAFLILRNINTNKEQSSYLITEQNAKNSKSIPAVILTADQILSNEDATELMDDSWDNLQPNYYNNENLITYH